MSKYYCIPHKIGLVLEFLFLESKYLMILNRVICNLWDKDEFTVSGAIIQTNLMDLIIFLCRDKNHRSIPRSHVTEKGGGNT